MVEIWVEDSTAGYRFIKEVNKNIYSNQFKIIPHAGIGDTKPTKLAKHGGILYHLRQERSTKLIILFIDKAVDRQETAVNYAKVVAEARKHKNIKIIEQVCFELIMLSYTNIFCITGNKNKILKSINDEFIEVGKHITKFRPYNLSSKLQKYILQNCNANQTQYEHIAKVLLSDITNVTTHYNNKEYRLSIISGSKIGPCWMKDCCIIECQYRKARKCSLEKQYTIKQKITDIRNNSVLKNITAQIDKFISEYCFDTYRCSDINKDKLYKEQYIKVNGKDNIIKHISKILDIQSNWNYERLYKLK